MPNDTDNTVTAEHPSVGDVVHSGKESSLESILGQMSNLLPDSTQAQETPAPTTEMNADILALFPGFTPSLNNEKGVIYTFARRGAIQDYEATEVCINNSGTVILKSVIKKTGINRKTGTEWFRYVQAESIILSLKQAYGEQPYLTVYRHKKRTKNHYASIQNVTSNACLTMGFRSYRSLDPLLYDEKVETETQQEYPYHIEPVLQYKMQNIIWNMVHKALHHKMKILEPDFPYHYSDANWLAYAAYPTLRILPHLEFGSLRELVAPGTVFKRETDLKPWLKSIGGKKTVRKDVIKAIASCTSPALPYLLHHFRGLVPPEWVIKLFTSDSEDYTLTKGGVGLNNLDGVTLRVLFRQLTLSQRKKLLFSTGVTNLRVYDNITREYSMMIDTCGLIRHFQKNKQWNTVLNEYWDSVPTDSWKSIHDYFSVVSRQLRTVNLPIPEDELYKTFDQTQYTVDNTSYVIHSPKQTHDLILWGNALNNCIASYRESVLSFRTHVLLVTKNDNPEPFAAIEYHSERVVQFMENYNSPVHAEIRAGFEELAQTLLKKKKNNKK